MKQFHKRIKLYRYLRKYAANLSIKSLVKSTTFQDLKKSKKVLKEMLAGKNPLQPHQEEFINWVYNTIPHNDNWRVWLARHYKKKPEDFTPEIKSKIQHYADMARGDATEIESVRFDKTHDLHTGLSMFEEAEKLYQQRLLDKERKLVPTEITKFFNKAATPNRAWFHLGARFDAGEKRVMGHCADTHTEKSKLISLRDIVKENGKTYHIPHVTASVYEFPDGSFYIGQMKGRYNEKPDPSFHKDIMELLKNPKMIGLLGLEYNPKKDFKFEELTPEQQEEVLKYNPFFIKNNDEKVTKGQEIAEAIQSDISKIKDLTQGHLNLFKDNITEVLDKHPKLFDDPEVVQKLIDSKLDTVLASHPYLFKKAPHLVEKFTNSKEWVLFKRIVENPNLFTDAPHLAEKLANDEDGFIRAAIASHKDFFTKLPHLVEKFANDKDWNVRSAIAKHPDLLIKFPHIAEKLANDLSYFVRQGIASQQNLATHAPHLAEKLTDDREWGVREEIAKNRNLLNKFPHLFEKLANDIFYVVRQQIAEHPDLFTKFPHIAEKLANDSEIDVRKQIASHKDLFTKAPHIAEKLVNDGSMWVRKQIASHPDLFTKAPHLVRKLNNDVFSDVHSSLANNASKQGINLDQFLQNLKNNTQKSEKLTINRYLRLLKYKF